MRALPSGRARRRRRPRGSAACCGAPTPRRAGARWCGGGLVVAGEGALHGVRGVVEGAHHPGDVAPRGVGQHPLGERLGRLALEVDDLPAQHGAQGLAEVQVAVDPLHVQLAERLQRVVGTAQAAAVLGASSGTTGSPRRAGRRIPSATSAAGQPSSVAKLSARVSCTSRQRDRRAGWTRRRSRRRPRRRAGRPRRTGCARWSARGPSRRWRCAGTAAASPSWSSPSSVSALDPAVELARRAWSRPRSAARGSRCRG